MSLAYRTGERPHRSIAQAGGMPRVEAVGQPEHELQLGTELEERQIEVAAHACLEEDIVALELQYVIVPPAEVDDGAEPRHDIRPVVARTLRGVDDVSRAGDVDRLEVLRAAAQAVRSLGLIVAEGDMPAAEIKSRSNAEREIIVQARLT